MLRKIAITLILIAVALPAWAGMRKPRPIDRMKMPAEYIQYARLYTKMFLPPGYDCRWFLAQMFAESSFNPNAISPCGAAGLMQLMPATFREIQSRMRWVKNRNNPRENIAAGIKYMSTLRKKWKSRRPERDRLALASYNGGFGNPLKAQKLCFQDGARGCNLWRPIAARAHRVRSWRHRESLHYVYKIFRLMGERL
jgi:membrane-bound lytic murein transglycosylase MltF